MYSEILRTIKASVISNFRRVLNVVFFLLGDSQAPEFYMPTFRNTVSPIFTGDVSSLPAHTAYWDGTDRVFRNVHKIQTPRNHPKERIQQLSHQFKHLKQNGVNCQAVSLSAKYFVTNFYTWDNVVTDNMDWLLTAAKGQIISSECFVCVRACVCVCAFITMLRVYKM